jgi:hypothetical protein
MAPPEKLDLALSGAAAALPSSSLVHDTRRELSIVPTKNLPLNTEL